MVSAAQSDLFAGTRLAGLTQAEGIVTENEEQALIASIDAVNLSPFRFHGWLGRRLTASFGWNYDYETAQFTPTEPIPDWLCPLRVRAARFACVKPDDLVQALLIRYDPGAGIRLASGSRSIRPVRWHLSWGAADDAIQATWIQRL